ncbi:hypothetical protein JQN58_21095 [Aneurinibacillus sp. BA2021]|nr:hypothetical protein [Aneurinibacillus sp. BA2021]
MRKTYILLFFCLSLILGNLAFASPGQASEAEYKPFLSRTVAGANLNELKNGYIPQGITYYAAKNWILVSYYHAKQPSILTVIDNKTGKQLKKVSLRNTNGTSYKGHAGGITISGANLWVSSDKKVHRIPLSTLVSAQNNASITFSKSVPVHVQGSYVLYKNNVLWVGEFVKAGGKGKIAGYKLKNGDFTTSKPVPDYMMDTPDRVQGMEIIGSSLVFSRSHGRGNDSYLSYYKNPVGSKADGYVGAAGKKIPYWDLTKNKRFQKTIKMPSMSEGIVVVGSRLYVIFESGASAYPDSKAPRIKHIKKYAY